MLITEDLTICPSCGMEIVIDDVDADKGSLHCPNCGQLISLENPNTTVSQREW